MLSSLTLRDILDVQPSSHDTNGTLIIFNLVYDVLLLIPVGKMNSHALVRYFAAFCNC